ncbi:MAG: hypothetical protein P8P74_12635 [Crocinitomicaceae bacterium]|nr:hypothetical protein [Crocinitomicaceae bacterium]
MINYPLGLDSDIYFCDDSIPSNAQLISLDFFDKVALKEYEQFNKIGAFVIDTCSANRKGYSRFYGSPDVFDTLVFHNASQKPKGSYCVADINDSVVAEIKDWNSFLKGMIQIGIVGTYSHLFSEMVTSKIEETSDSYRIQFKVVWHYCTNDCYDPKYKFALYVNKKDGSIMLIK